MKLENITQTKAQRKKLSDLCLDLAKVSIIAGAINPIFKGSFPEVELMVSIVHVIVGVALVYTGLVLIAKD